MQLCISVCVSVCVCVCVCGCVFLWVKNLCGSGSHWPETFNMAAAWFNGAHLSICLDCNDTVYKLFHKCFTNSAEHCPLEPPQSHAHQSQSLTWRNKQIYTSSSTSWTGILPAVRSSSVLFCASKTDCCGLMTLNGSGASLFGSEKCPSSKFGCWGTGEVVGGMEADEWQATTVGVETAILRVERFVTFSVFGVYS